MRVESGVERSAPTSDSLPLGPSSGAAQSITKHAINITFIVVAILALFWRVFFLGETLIDVKTLDNQLPWGYSAGESDYPYNRRDLTDTYVTRDYFVVSAYRSGEFPLWNPYTMAGHPIYADGVTRTLSPFLLFYKFFDVPLGYSLARLIELILAAVFMYLFLIGIGARASGGLLGSLVFAFSAHSMLHLTGLGWWGGLMWLPLIMLFADRAIRRRSYAQAMLGGVFLALQFFCGYLPNQIYYVGALVLYYLFFAVASRRRRLEGHTVVRVIAMMVVTLAVGLVLSATQWIPSVELLSHSNRKIIGAELGYIYLPPWYLATLLFPNLFGSAYDANMLKLFTALGVSHDHILYLGICALLPMGFGIYWLGQQGRRRNGDSSGLFAELDQMQRLRVIFFVVLATCSLILMMAAPLYVHLTRFIPILQVIRVAVRAGVLFLFAAVVLVAFGTDLLLRSDTPSLLRFARIARRFVIVVSLLVMVAVVGSYLIRFIGITVKAGERGRMAFISRAAVALSSQFNPPNAGILIPLALLFAGAFLIWLLAKERLTKRSFFYSVLVLLMIDLFWNSNQFDHVYNRSRVFPRTEITDLLHSLPPGRVLIVPSDLETNRSVSAGTGPEKIIAPPNTLLPYQISTVTGKNQQFPGSYREFASLIEPQPNLSHVVFNEYRSPFFDLLNVRYVMTHASAPAFAGYDLLTSAEGVSVYENKGAMPRAFFAREAVRVGSPADSLTAMRAPNFDPKSQTVVEDDDALLSQAALPDQIPRLNSVRIVEDKNNWVAIETDNPRDGLLVLSDNYYPGWRAYVDGSPTRILKANHTMRAVRVPAGHHVVSFAFMPAAFFVSMYVSFAAAALTVVALSFSAFKRNAE